MYHKDFLLLNEYGSLKNDNNNSVQQAPPSESIEKCFITCNEATVGWQSQSSNNLSLTPSHEDRMLLESVTLNIKMGQVLGIIGQVGSGKVSIVYCDLKTGVS